MPKLAQVGQFDYADSWESRTHTCTNLRRMLAHTHTRTQADRHTHSGREMWQDVILQRIRNINTRFSFVLAFTYIC